jgi:hypothetical protein
MLKVCLAWLRLLRLRLVTATMEKLQREQGISILACLRCIKNAEMLDLTEIFPGCTWKKAVKNEDCLSKTG